MSEYIVRMRCIVVKDVCVSNCTKEEARSNPWDFANDETEVEQLDWDVIDVTENK